ncbi:Hypothetical predicted protein, partial [Mytilus galloprovincialis]
MISLQNESDKLKKALNATVPENERFQIEKDLSQTQQAMKVICGKARSEKAKQQLKEDYKLGLRVFDNVEDTEIPKLRKWISEKGERKKQAATQQLMFNLGLFLKEIKNYLTENDFEFKDDSEIVKSEVEKVCEELQQELQNTSKNLLNELRKEISKTENNLAIGVKSAEATAVAVCRSW